SGGGVRWPINLAMGHCLRHRSFDGKDDDRQPSDEPSYVPSQFGLVVIGVTTDSTNH
ncbi:hypothetical protein HAX54_047932, partial [Datura stramonium]|nr:hypothetical protein [Datura stramonium]